jgi:predicted O-methyltransferase YrrM
MIEPAFFERVAHLQAPSTGTEQLAPLLYYLLRGTRPRRVLEIGMGYTTPFLARALADNAAEVERERAPLAAKTRAYLERGDAPPIGEDTGWLWARPALVDPSFYHADHRPQLTVVDDFSSPKSAARAVMATLEELDLHRGVTFHQGDFRDVRDAVAAGGPYDLAWFDCGGEPEYRFFIEHYWDLVSDDGGYVIIHRALTNRGRGAVVRELKEQLARGARDDFEMVSVLEPHKLTQNSYCVIRKTGAYRERYYEDEPERIRDAAVRLLEEPLAPAAG